VLRRKRKDLGGIPTSSMSDVAFLLLIFFLSTTKFDIKKGLGIVLPAASDNTTKKVRLKNENLTKIMVISLKTDRKSKYHYMVEVLDKLQASGAEKISLSTN